MRKIRDERGREWEVVLGRQSWGAFLALFVPSEGVGVRSAALAAADHSAAARELMAMDQDELSRMLERSERSGSGLDPDSEGS